MCYTRMRRRQVYWLPESMSVDVVTDVGYPLTCVEIHQLTLALDSECNNAIDVRLVLCVTALTDIGTC